MQSSREKFVTLSTTNGFLNRWQNDAEERGGLDGEPRVDACAGEPLEIAKARARRDDERHRRNVWSSSECHAAAE